MPGSLFSVDSVRFAFRPMVGDEGRGIRSCQDLSSIFLQPRLASLFRIRLIRRVVPLGIRQLRVYQDLTNRREMRADVNHRRGSLLFSTKWRHRRRFRL
jgi:hypothetical protein